MRFYASHVHPPLPFLSVFFSASFAFPAQKTAQPNHTQPQGLVLPERRAVAAALRRGKAGIGRSLGFVSGGFVFSDLFIFVSTGFFLIFLRCCFLVLGFCFVLFFPRTFFRCGCSCFWSLFRFPGFFSSDCIGFSRILSWSGVFFYRFT